MQLQLSHFIMVGPKWHWQELSKVKYFHFNLQQNTLFYGFKDLDIKCDLLLLYQVHMHAEG